MSENYSFGIPRRGRYGTVVKFIIQSGTVVGGISLSVSAGFLEPIFALKLCFAAFTVLLAGLCWSWAQLAVLRFEVDHRFFKSRRGIIVQRTESLDLCKVRDISMTRNLIQKALSLSTLKMKTTDLTCPFVTVKNMDHNMAQDIFDYVNYRAADEYAELMWK